MSSSLVVGKIRDAQELANDVKSSLVPDTLEQCTAPVPEYDDGLTEEEKFQAISRLEASGRTRTSEGVKLHELQNADGPSLKLKLGYVCQTGYYPEDLSKRGQDDMLVALNIPGHEDACLLAVFDGHGKDGTECSGFAADRFGKYLVGHKQFRANPEKALEDACVKTNKDMHKAKKKRKGSAGYFDDTLAGTTAVSVLFLGDEVVVSNVGDSRAVLATSSEDGKLVATPLSVDQTPYREDERARCRKAGAVVMTMDQLEGYKPYDPLSDDWGDEEGDGGDPPRLWRASQGCPGVAFTRSLGDEMAEGIGCVPNPEIVRRRVLPTDKFLVIASDGVFEFLASQTVVDIVSKFTDPYEAARALVAESYKLWLHYEVRTDDITAIVVFIDHPDAGAPLSRRAMMAGASAANMSGSFRDMESMRHLDQQNKPVRREMSRKKRAIIEASTVLADEEKNADDGVPTPVHKKSPEQVEQIKMAITTNFLFQHLNPVQLAEVLNAFEHVDVAAGDAVIKQGELGDRFYVVASGEYDCFIRQDAESGSESGGGGGGAQAGGGAPLPQDAPGDMLGSSGQQKKVHTYVARQGSTSVGNPSFGELALMYSKPRAASVVAKTAGALWALDRKTFRRVLVKQPNKELLAGLRGVAVLESLGKHQLQRLADKVGEMTFHKGDVVIRQGDVGDTMFIVRQGEARCTIGSPEAPDFDPSTAKEVMRVAQGSYFGEKALIQSEPRAASVLACAEGDTLCYYISKKSFEEVLGPLADIIQRHSRKRELEGLAEVQMRDDAKKQHIPENVRVEDLAERYKSHERGAASFRVVQLKSQTKSQSQSQSQSAAAQSMSTSTSAATSAAAAEPFSSSESGLFTLKSYSRGEVERLKTESMVLRDRALLPLAGVRAAPVSVDTGSCMEVDEPSSPSSPVGAAQAVFPVLRTFVGVEQLHVALAGVVCGPLSDFMSAAVSEDVGRFVVTQAVAIMEHLHLRGIMCRSINPQMLMLDGDGFLRLADLGCGKYLEDASARSFTMCGDACYVAPEQVLNQGHSAGVDYWALGVLAYELLVGALPFDESRDVFSQISGFKLEDLALPDVLSAEAKAFIGALMNPSPALRVTNMDELKQSAFLAGVDWDGVRAQSNASPLKDAAASAIADMLKAQEQAAAPAKDIDASAPAISNGDAWFKDF